MVSPVRVTPQLLMSLAGPDGMSEDQDARRGLVRFEGEVGRGLCFHNLLVLCFGPDHSCHIFGLVKMNDPSRILNQPLQRK